MAPKDEAELRDMLLTAIEYPGPAALRYPRGNGIGVDISAAPKKLEIGKSEILREGKDLAICAYGSMVHPAMQAAENLGREGIEATVVNARFVKPLDKEMFLSLAENFHLIVTVEEAYLAGGFGSAVLELFEENGVLETVKMVRMGVPDKIITHGDAKLLLAKYGLDSDGIFSKIKEEYSKVEKRSAKKGHLKAIK
jgi:1-deoxy-D-xylulose-5-phosphate synthase